MADFQDLLSSLDSLTIIEENRLPYVGGFLHPWQQYLR
jgi:hypothetical protein